MSVADERDYVIPADRLPFSPADVLLNRLSDEDREQVRARLAGLGQSLRRDAEGDEPQD